jgi:hypothetical protein
MLLATLAAQSLNHQALTTPPVDIVDSAHTKEAGDHVVSDPTEKQGAMKRAPNAIASPESLVAQEFSPEASPSSKLPNTQPVEDTQKVVEPTRESPAPQATNTAIASPEIAPKATSISIAPPEIAPPETRGTVARTSTQNNASMPMGSSAAPQVAPAKTLAELQRQSEQQLQAVPTPNQSAKLLASRNSPTSQGTVSPQQTPAVVAQGVLPSTEPCLEVEGLQTQLRDLEKLQNSGEFQASPALSIAIPTGFGADNNTGFISATYQQRTRYGNVSDGGVGIGVGLGDARKAVGVELSYTAASFGGSRDFGAGGLNVKVHRQLADDLSVAAGWNGILNVGGRNDFENSIYGSVTKVLRTREDINTPFSRVAVTAGVGSGQFRSESAVVDGSGGVNVFGNVAVRVAQPVSVIAEWSGQDLGVGLSVAPFKNIPLVITPAVRDLVGAGDGPRFVLGTGLAFKF